MNTLAVIRPPITSSNIAAQLRIALLVHRARGIQSGLSQTFFAEVIMARRKGHWQSERCTVCSHPKIGIINFALARGTSRLAVAKEHGLGASAVYNHNRAHIEENYRKIIGSGVYADIDELLKKCSQGDAESLDVLNAMISGFFHNWSLPTVGARSKCHPSAN